MKAQEIRELPDNELRRRITDEEQNLAHLLFQKATSQLESPIKIRTVRRMIARMKTIFRQREIKQGRSAAAATATSTTTNRDSVPQL